MVLERGIMMKLTMSTWMGLGFTAVCIVTFVWYMLAGEIGAVADGVANLMGGGANP